MSTATTPLTLPAQLVCELGLAVPGDPPVEPHDDHDEDVAAARRLNGAGNRLFLDPVLHGEYSADMLKHDAPSTETWIRSGSRWTCRD